MTGQPGADRHVDRVLVEAHLGEVQPRRVRVDAHAVHRADRVGAGEADPQVGVEEDHAVADARRVLELVVVLAEREAALGDHRREALERRQVVLLELADAAAERGPRLAGDDGDDRPAVTHRDALHVGPLGRAEQRRVALHDLAGAEAPARRSGRATSSTTAPTRSIG